VLMSQKVSRGLHLATFITPIIFISFIGCSPNGSLGPRSANTVASPLNPFPSGQGQPPLTCDVATSESQISVMMDENGNFQAPPASITIQAFRGDIPVQFRMLNQGYDNSGIERLPDGSSASTISFRPIRSGRHVIEFEVADFSNLNETATCSTEISLDTTDPPEIYAALNGSEENLEVPVARNQGVYFTWRSANATNCAVTINGEQTEHQGMQGEFFHGPLENDSQLVIEYSFEVTCLSSVSDEVRIKSVTAKVNPNPTGLLSVGLASGTVQVISGANVILTWVSQFALGGCFINEGLINTPVAPNDSLVLPAVRANRVLTLVCRDQFQGLAQSSLALEVVNPELSVTANNTSASYNKVLAETVTVAWDGTDVLDCELEGSSTTGKSGSVAVVNANLRSNMTFTVNCSTLGDPISASVAVNLPGQWVQVDRKVCSTECSNRGLENRTSPEGAFCAAGENIPTSSLGSHGTISYTHGCWPNCSAHVGNTPTSVGGMCYSAGQKRDNDRTDRTVGCFCV